MNRQYFAYILASNSGVLYIGVTNDLQRRLAEHQRDSGRGFTAQYKVRRLVYFEWCTEVKDAIAREKQLKGWRRQKKVALIESMNPTWADLSDQIYGRRQIRLD